MLFYDPEPYVLDISGNDAVEGFGNYFKSFWSAGTEVDVSAKK